MLAVLPEPSETRRPVRGFRLLICDPPVSQGRAIHTHISHRISAISGFEIAAAIATPPGLFTVCLQCFDLIQAGRDFGKDYERSLIRLRAAHLRLVRWGETVGLAVSDLSTPVPTRISNTPSEETTAKDHLAAILVDLAEVSKMCSQYDSNRTPAKANDENNGNLESASVTSGGGALVLRELKERMQGQASERQRTTTLVHKLTWVCHGKK